MNLTDITKQAMQLAVNGYINGEKFTQSRLYNQLNKMLNTTPSKYIFEISMPDGRWYCKAIKEDFGYDLIVPDTREQESWIKKEL